MPSPPTFFLALAGILGAYAVLAETVKRFFYKRYGNRVEQVLVPKSKTIYTSRTAKFMQDMIAVISLRFEDEISIDSLSEDLTRALNYPINLNQMIKNLQHLKRSGLISVDWQRRTIKREEELEEYVKKNFIDNEIWSRVAEDWRRISTSIESTRTTLNSKYKELFNRKEK